MSYLTRVLYPLPDHRRTGWSLFHWWESRRLTYNVAVGGAGLFTLGAVHLLAWLPPGVPMSVGWQPVVAFGVLANVYYTGGWLMELGMKALWGPDSPRAGPALFRQGLIFSVGVTQLPVLLSAFWWITRVIRAIF